MDDMTMLAELGDRLDHQPPATLVRQRQRLLDAAQGRRRRRIWPVLTGGLAAATAAAVAIVAVDTHGVAHQPAAPPAVTLSAAVILNKAADVAEQLPAVTPTAHQWLYQKFVQYGTGYPTPQIEEGWIRFDGTQDAFTENGHLVVENKKTLPFADTPLGQYAWAQSLPTEPHALLAAMEQQVSWGKVQPTEKEKFITLLTVARGILTAIAPPAVRAAIYRALALLPGVRIEQVTDGLGQHDLGVTQGDGHTVLLLNRSDYQAIGELSTAPYEPHKQDTPSTSGLILEALAVVDDVGQR